MCIIASDGHIVAIPGPYLGRNNDASMTKHLATIPLKPTAQTNQQQGQQGQDQNQGQPDEQTQGQGQEEAPLGGFQTE